MIDRILKYKIADFILWGIILIFSLKFIFLGMNTLPFSPDSWSYWELSHSVFSNDSYRIHGWRQFQTTEPYSMSFPPLWPILISIFNYMFSIGPAIMPLLAGLMFLLGIIIIEFTFRQYFKTNYLGIFSGLILLINPGFLGEITAGRSIPLCFLIISVMFNMWLQSPKFRHILALALLSGLLILTRFDMLPFIILFGLAIYIKLNLQELNKGKMKFIFFFYVTVLLVISPYIYYSIIHFQTLFATDNSLVSKSAYKIFVTYFFIDYPPTLIEKPLVWISRILGNSITLFSILKKVFIFLIFTISILLLIYRLKKETIQLKLFSIFVLFYLMSLSSYILTGYYDSRYFVVLILYIYLLDLISIKTLLNNKSWNVLIIPFVIIFIGYIPIKHKTFHWLDLYVDPLTEHEKMVSYKMLNFEKCYQENIGSKVQFLDASRSLFISSFLHIDTTLTPGNFNILSNQEKQYFLQTYNIKAYYGDNVDIFKSLQNVTLEQCKFDSKYKYIKEK